MPQAVLCCAMLCQVEMCCAALNYAVRYLICRSSRPWRPTPDRTDLDLELELPERMARPELVAIETCGALNQLEACEVRAGSLTLSNHYLLCGAEPCCDVIH